MKEKKIQHQCGISMIEILVTLVVVGVGMLGVAQMQIISMQANHEASQRNLAVQYANDMIDKMRSVSSFYVTSYDNQTVGGNSISTEPTPTCMDANGDGTLSASEVCTVQQKISHDLWEWEQMLDGASELSSTTKTGGLLNANGCINVSNNHIEVIITWDGRSSAVKSAAVTTIGNCGGLGASALTKRRQIKIQTVI